MTAAVAATRARLYGSVRSAHLERAHALAPAAIIYRTQRYDFDDRLTEGLELHRTSTLRVAALLGRSAVRELEINEPLMLNSLPTTAAALGGLAVRRLLGRGRTTVVTYAIGNDDPFLHRPTRIRPRIRRALDLALARLVADRVDRIAFGTGAAQDVYERRLPQLRSAKSLLVPALPAPRPAPLERRAGTVVFLGAFVARKGLPQVLAAWPAVQCARPGASLLLLGKGALEAEAQAAAESDPSIEVVIDPPREAIFAALDVARVLVLPSQPSATWREQIGLPIVEGLASGCGIVTTLETGLAPWLMEHQHEVVQDPRDVGQIAAAIIAQLDDQRSAADITRELPARDGRLSADDWLFGHEDDPR